eukprot:COSAG06_NODE_24095_length_673_cov_0.658537_1_plen_23_part_10
MKNPFKADLLRLDTKKNVALMVP